MPGGRTGNVRWGQNFLVDRNVARAIVEWADVGGHAVLEIGPGRGILTELLSDVAASVCAVEIDRELVEQLSLRFSANAGVRIVAGDALATDFSALLSTPVRVVSNLPYDCGTAIVERLLAARGLVEDMVVMLQREVCERIAAAPGDKSYGLLSVHTQLDADVRVGRVVAPGCFRPAPKVDSQVLRITPLAGSRFAVGDRAVFDRLTAVAFQGRRKMLRNTVGTWIDERCGDGAAGRAFAAVDVRPDRRPETLPIDRFAALSAWVVAEEAR